MHDLDSILKALAIVGSVILTPTIVLAAIRMVLFFGALKKTVESLERTTTALADTLAGFAAEVRSDLRSHGERITAVETEVENMKERVE